MLAELVAIIIMVVFTLLAFRKNAVVMLSLSFTIIYVIEILLYYFDLPALYSFFMTLGAKYPPDVGIFTGMFLHSISPGHVFFNILFFFLAGMPFEREIGSRKFTAIFLISGVIANLGYSLYLHIFGVNSILIGASGAIFGIMGAFIIMYPN
ncbi:MAG: rhomboid family intramembrane serine protease, partial [Euryarchaeota archaeon]|nr:rhomboid family intramembrane serine protease [Euryarchaeota archaeon]